MAHSLLNTLCIGVSELTSQTYIQTPYLRPQNKKLTIVLG